MLEWFIPESLGLSWAIGIALLTVVTSAITAMFGIGGGLMMMAALLMVLPPIVVLPVHALIQIVSNGSRAHAYREYVDWPLISWFTLGSVVGTLLASFVFFDLPEDILLLCMGGFILFAVWSPALQFSNLSLPSFTVVGAVLTFLAFFVGATGPLFAAVTHNRSPEKRVYIATHAVAVNVQHILKILVFGFFGFQFAEWLPFVLLTVITSYVGTYLGKNALNRLPDAYFKILFNWILTALALRLIYMALFASD